MPTLGTTDKLIFTIVNGNVGITAQTPTIVIQKQSNNYYFNGAGFTPTYIELNMVETDATNFAGKYEYDFNQGLDIAITNQKETYSIRYINTGTYALLIDEEIDFTADRTISYTAQAQPGIEFTKPGFQSPEQTSVVTKTMEKRIKATFVDANQEYYDPAILSVNMYDYTNTLVIQETYSASGTYIKKDSPGNYFIDYSPQDAGEYMFEWRYRDISGGEQFYEQSYLYSLDTIVWNLFPALKNQIDKAQKDMGIFGFTDVNIYTYLKSALSDINRVSPITSFTLASYPYNPFSQVLIDMATFYSLYSQGMVAIDTDSNYSLQGNSFTIDHFSKISGFLSFLNSRINEQLKQMKWNYMAQTGIALQRGPGFRSIQLWNASPSGVSYGNVMGQR